ncbi:asparagine synthase (glutamine-hydrolyzing) [Ferriphaselus sp. R-1]|uniref:asparagine synthase (glutamine-hydrolyzing) n=1 Tax=Ferriphaselus sp. R-1 TaxID=1485544 RepID=UPI000550F000|nr:asparagine synthase (glutamine-hydrolyzing) [Ferriphaselus sp. R-1]
MCGILGWLGDLTPADTPRFHAALDTLAHRGPDDSGVWVSADALLGHRRLSILDLSPAGHQPMVEPASGAVIVFNGEIYNHIELREQLEGLGHRFVGHSDTEVLLHALIEWGEAALPRLNGMWAFAYWQPERKRLLLARDRFGVKPLYYRKGADGLAFASEPKALLSLFPQHRAVNEAVLLDFLGNNLLYAHGESFYQGIHVMPPAHYAVYDLTTGSFDRVSYWQYPTEEIEGLTRQEAVAQFDALLTDAVRLRLRSDVPVGLTLSGGLDSTGILAAAGVNSSAPLTCFTSVYGNGEVGELPWAQRASDAAHAPLIPVAAPADDWLATLRKVAWHMDGPGYSPAVYPLWHLMKRARSEGVPVLLEGQGADEALAGYPQYAVLDLLDRLSDHPAPGDLMTRFAAMRRTFSLRWTAAWMARELSPTLLRWHRQRTGFESLLRDGVALPPVVPQPWEGKTDRVRQRLLADHAQNILPGLLHYGDAISMAHGIEARHPFMDYRLVEWMFRLPKRLRFDQGETKSVLREYLRKHGQIAIGNRPDKKGYPTPVGKWLASDQGREIEALLLKPGNRLHQWCDPAKIRRLIERNKQGVMGAEHHLYKLVSTQIWLDECIAGGEVA